MNTGDFSLMTFSLAGDVKKKLMTVHDTLQMAADSGIQYVDVMNIQEKSIETYRKAIAKTRVRVKCYISTISLFASERSINKSLEKEMAIAASLEAELFMIVPFYPIIDNKKARKAGHDKTLDILIHGFNIAIEKGQKYGLKVCFETTPHDDICLSGNEDCKYVLEHVPKLGFVFDTANMLPHGDDTLSAYRLLKDYIVHVHLKDVKLSDVKRRSLIKEYTNSGKLMTCCIWGEGVIPVKEIYQIMLDDGYTGKFAIEYTHPEESACTPAVHRVQLQKYMDYIV